MGANIKITSDSKQFQDQMKQLTQDLKVMSSELDVATTKAELFGSEQDKLGTKGKELSNSIKGQNAILNLQKQTITALASDIQKYKDRNTELSRSIADVETKLKESIKSTGEDSKETKQLQQELSKLQKEYQANEKAIDKSNKQIDTYKIKMNETEKAILQSKKALEETDKKLASMKWDKASKNLESFGNKAKEIGEGLTTKVTLPIVAAGGASVKLASDMTESLNKVDVAFNSNAREIKKWSDTTLNNFGLAKGTALDMASSYGDMATSMGFTTNQAAKMSEQLVGRAADLSSFKNISIDVANTALTSIFSGETESLKKLGVVMTQTNLQEYAASKGIKTKVQDMSQAEQVQLRYNYVMEKTKNAQGDFARTSDGVANSSRVTMESVKQLGAEFGQNLLPIIASILKPLNEMLKGLSKLSPEQQKIVIGVGAVLASIGPVLILIGKMSLGLSTITGLFTSTAGGATAAGGAVTGLANPIGLIVAAIAAVIAAIVYLWNTNSDFRNAVIALGNNLKDFIIALLNLIKSVWGGCFEDIKAVAKTAWDFISIVFITAVKIIGDIFKIFTALLKGDWSGVWNGMKALLSDVWEGIKNILSSGIRFIVTAVSAIGEIIFAPFRWAKDKVVNIVSDMINSVVGFFKRLKLPSIGVKVKWGGPGDAIPYPSFDIKWNAQGGILNKATIFGSMGNTLLGGGEAGAEGIIPLKELWNELSKNFDKLEERLGNKQQDIYITNITTLDGKEIARETAPYVSNRLALNSIGRR